MKIGILTFHSVCNFGANLQALSTVEWLKKNDLVPLIINWVPKDLELHDKKMVSLPQYVSHEDFSKKYLPLTNVCRTFDQVVEVIKKNGLSGIIIGSDAVIQHKTFWDRIIFPSKKVLTITGKPAEHLRFPNPFWGGYLEVIGNIPCVMMSVSSQNTRYKKIPISVKKLMSKRILSMKYVSVRDNWTSFMIKHITGGRRNPVVTPDPVWGFEYNCSNLIPSEQEIRKKFNLPENYVLLSFNTNYTISKKWVNSFSEICFKNNIQCIQLPMPKGFGIDQKLMRTINLPLDPLDWYSLIKYSNGYVGNNMHPLIVCLHNQIPFYIFDHYGITTLRLFVNKSSSKIYDLLSSIEFLKSYINSAIIFFSRPKPQYVFESILSMDKLRLKKINESMFEKYSQMMNSIKSIFTKNHENSQN